jgi:hypothetical protein
MYIITFIVIGLILLALMAVPIIVSYQFYLELSEKSRLYKKIGFAIFISISALIVFFSIRYIYNGAGFGPEHNTVILKQDIGGELIYASVYTSDQHSWQYDIDYLYINENGDSIDFGHNSYCGCDWKENEKVYHLKDLYILQTNPCRNIDKLIIKNMLTDSLVSYRFDQKSFEKTNSSNIDNESIFISSYISSIKDSKVLVEYKTQTMNSKPNEFQVQNIEYEINDLSGDLKIIGSNIKPEHN